MISIAGCWDTDMFPPPVLADPAYTTSCTLPFRGVAATRLVL